MFIQVAVNTQEEFDRAFAKMEALGYSSEGADPIELVFNGAGYVKFSDSPMMGYYWYSGMDMLPILLPLRDDCKKYNSVEEFEAI